MRQEQEEAWAEGHSAGLKEDQALGEEEALITQIGKKLAKGKPVRDCRRTGGNRRAR